MSRSQIAATIALAGLAIGVNLASAQSTESFPKVYRGCREASAAVPLGDEYFIAANDEDNILRVYKLTQSEPIEKKGFDLKLNPDSKEHEEKKRKVDIEAATRIGKTLTLWIGSHSRTTEKHKLRKSRFRLFGVNVNDKKPGEMQFVGFYDHLLHDMLKADKKWGLGLNSAFGMIKDKKHKLGPKDPGGFNIEGMTTIAGKKAVYIGFRNPLIGKDKDKDKAILLPLLNPFQLITGQAKKSKFGKPILLDLGGLGIRSIEYCHYRKKYFIVAGAFGQNQAGKFKIYTWSGKPKDKPAHLRTKTEIESKFTPEALILYGDSEAIQLLSDHGTEPKKGEDPKMANSFQSRWVYVDAKDK